MRYEVNLYSYVWDRTNISKSVVLFVKSCYMEDILDLIQFGTDLNYQQFDEQQTTSTFFYLDNLLIDFAHMRNSDSELSTKYFSQILSKSSAKLCRSKFTPFEGNIHPFNKKEKKLEIAKPVSLFTKFHRDSLINTTCMRTKPTSIQTNIRTDRS